MLGLDLVENIERILERILEKKSLTQRCSCCFDYAPVKKKGWEPGVMKC